MFRSVVVVGTLLVAPAAGQEGWLPPRRITAPIVDRGVYHVATGTWTRGAAFSSDVLYNNSSPSGYFSTFCNEWDPVDGGRLPSTSSQPIVGTADAFRVDAYRIAYCSSDTLGVDQLTSFYEAWVPCTGVDPLTPAASFLATGLPGGTSTGGEACWTVTFDLSNTTLEFVLRADADGQWDDDPNVDSFGWLSHWPSNNQGCMVEGLTGPVIAGNCAGGGSASVPPKGFGTAFAGTPGATDATGLGQGDFFWVDGANVFGLPNANGGCFFFGGCNNLTGPGANPWAGFYMVMFGSSEGSLGTRYCSSRANTSGDRALIAVEGSDASADLVLVSTPVPSTTGQFFYGPMMLAGTQDLGDGLRCVGGMTTRLLPLTVAGMMMQAPNTAMFTINYTAPYAAGLQGTQHFQHWFRSGTSAGTGSNTSDAISISF